MKEHIFYKRVLNPFGVKTFDKGRAHPVFFVIDIGGWNHSSFAVCGYHINGGGQCIDDFIGKPKVYTEGWNDAKYQELIDLWKKYHLKGCPPESDFYKELVAKCDTFPESKDTQEHTYFTNH